MAAFSPFSLLSTGGMGMPMPVAMQAASAVDPATTQRLNERVAQAEAREAEARAAVDQRLAVDEAEQRLAEEARRADLAAEEAATGRDLDRSQAARQADLRRAQASERTRQAAAGISSGRTARTLLEGLRHAADSDRAAQQQDAEQRLADIRRETETARRKDLLAMADARRRADLTRHAAATDTAFAKRSAALGQAAAGLDRAASSGGGSRSLGEALYGAAGQLFSRW